MKDSVRRAIILYVVFSLMSCRALWGGDAFSNSVVALATDFPSKQRSNAHKTNLDQVQARRPDVVTYRYRETADGTNAATFDALHSAIEALDEIRGHLGESVAHLERVARTLSGVDPHQRAFTCHLLDLRTNSIDTLAHSATLGEQTILDGSMGYQLISPQDWRLSARGNVFDATPGTYPIKVIVPARTTSLEATQPMLDLPMDETITINGVSILLGEGLSSWQAVDRINDFSWQTKVRAGQTPDGKLRLDHLEFGTHTSIELLTNRPDSALGLNGTEQVSLGKDIVVRFNDKELVGNGNEITLDSLSPSLELTFGQDYSDPSQTLIVDGSLSIIDSSLQVPIGGETVRLTIPSATSDALRLHGYDSWNDCVRLDSAQNAAENFRTAFDQATETRDQIKNFIDQQRRHALNEFELAQPTASRIEFESLFEQEPIEAVPEPTPPVLFFAFLAWLWFRDYGRAVKYPQPTIRRFPLKSRVALQWFCSATFSSPNLASQTSI